MDVELLTGDDWKVLRDLRLDSLEDSPKAFLSTDDAGEDRDEEYWRQRCAEGNWVVALSGHQAIGIACSVEGSDEPPDARYIQSVWVDPARRRNGVLRAMLRHLIALEPDVRTWFVWILDGNDVAREVYARMGFETTRRRKALKSDPERSEERLMLAGLDYFTALSKRRSAP
ncbi:GNAT family N-acetyltransferase [Kribbella sp. DT2]|uniref:GNAT family N-acetyltransferase n=1 Tax=Kribbella sp. DT2 TaxID=3393427 RepID=UPI003CF84456